MSRDCIKVADEVNINERFDMTVNDMNRFREAYGDDPALLLIKVFAYGYAQGKKAEKEEK